MINKYDETYNPFNPMKALIALDRLKAIQKWEQHEGELLPPLVFNIDPTNRCNHNCKHCMWAAEGSDLRNEYRDSELSTEHMVRLTHAMVDWGVEACCVAGGGEPTLHPGLPDLLNTLHFCDIDTLLVSNGMELKGALADTAIRTCRAIGFSVDAGSPEVYAKIRRVDSKCFEKTMKNLEYICARKDKSGRHPLHVGYKFLVFPENYEDIPKAAKIARDVGVDHLQIRPPHMVDKKALVPLVEDIRINIQKAKEFETDSFKVVGMTHKFHADLTPRHYPTCRITPTTVTCMANGWVAPCPDTRDYAHYWLCKHQPEPQELVDFWGSEAHRNIIERIEPSQCRRCTCIVHADLLEKFIERDLCTAKLI